MRFALLVLLAACQDNKVGVYNTPPTASVLSPASGASFAAGDLVELVGSVDDAQDNADVLAISWESSLDGVLSTEPADLDGNVYFATSTLSSGDHVVTLTVLDSAAESGSTSVAFTVGPGSSGVGGPTIVILGPEEGESYPDEGLNLVATVTDDEDAEDTLFVEVIDSAQGSLWTGAPSATGSLTVPLTLTPGDHTLTVNALDSDGNTGSANVSFEVLDAGRPTVAITAPADGAEYDLAELLAFSGIVGDDETPVETLAIAWSSDIDGTFATAPADSSGVVSTAYTLSAGIHTITLTATDEEGLPGSDSVQITVTDPFDRDDDGDGWTENEGDCADDAAVINPGASDICDELDNDCSGYVNDDDWDSYEPNPTSSDAEDLGEVDDSFGWSNSTLTLSGLTLSDEGDEDWFAWDADDEYYDNITITVSVTGLSARGDYVVELYDGDGNLVDSDDGASALSLSYEGDLFDDDEDEWSLRVYAASWPSSSCSSTYAITIHS